MTNERGEPQTIGIWMTTALVIGTIIGSGIFLLPVSLAPLGANALIGWLVSGVGVLCIAFALAQLSRLGGDGIQANIEREFGPTVGFLVAWAFWVSNWVAQASVAVGAASALSFIGPEFGGPELVVPLAIGWRRLADRRQRDRRARGRRIFGRDRRDQAVAAAGRDLAVRAARRERRQLTNRWRRCRSPSPTSPLPPR